MTRTNRCSCLWPLFSDFVFFFCRRLYFSRLVLDRLISPFLFQGHFLAWHRYFVAAYEKALREECSYDGAQPYG